MAQIPRQSRRGTVNFDPEETFSPVQVTTAARRDRISPYLWRKAASHPVPELPRQRFDDRQLVGRIGDEHDNAEPVRVARTSAGCQTSIAVLRYEARV